MTKPFLKGCLTRFCLLAYYLDFREGSWADAMLACLTWNLKWVGPLLLSTFSVSWLSRVTISVQPQVSAWDGRVAVCSQAVTAQAAIMHENVSWKHNSSLCSVVLDWNRLFKNWMGDGRAQRCKSMQELNLDAANSPFPPDRKHLSSSERDRILAHHVKANLAG